MQIILEGDPAFKRVVMKSSFGANEIKNNVADTDDGIMDNNGEENSKYKFIKVVYSSSKPEIQKNMNWKRQWIFKKMNEIQEKINAILEKYVENLLSQSIIRKAESP